jgi:nucleoside-diphosphate-sugar epimerase
MPVVSRSEEARVLVTGCGGFTGQFVRKALVEHGYRVFDAEQSGTRFDLTEPASIRPVLEEAAADYVIHLAALSFVGHAESAAFYAVNAVGTTNLLDQILALGAVPRRIVIASSANVYGNASVEPITEATPPAPVNHYAASKVAMESLARAYSDRLNIVMTRPFNYTGVGQSPRFLVPKMVSHFLERRPFIELGNLDVVRDFSDVRAVAQAYVRLLEADVPDNVVNLCSGVGRSLRWILEQLTEISGHRLELRVNAEFVRASEVHRLVGSSSRMETALGPLPHRDFRETLAWMLDVPSAPLPA